MMLLINASPAAPREHVLVLYQHPGGPQPLGHGDHLLHVGDAGRGALEVKVDDPVLRNVRLTGSLGDDGRNCWILVPIIGLILVWEKDWGILKHKSYTGPFGLAAEWHPGLTHCHTRDCHRLRCF